MVNRPREWRVCKHLYEKSRTHPGIYFTADEMSRNIFTSAGNGTYSRKTYRITPRQIGYMFRSSKIYEYAEFDIRDIRTEGRYNKDIVHEYRFKRGLVKEFQP